MRALISLFACLLYVPAGAQSLSQDAAMQAFYAWVLSNPVGSIPNETQRREMTRFTSPTLLAIFKAAEEAQSRCEDVTPRGNKGDIFDGNLLVGNGEGATEVSYGTARRKGDVVVVNVELMLTDPRWPKGNKYRSFAWRDRLELRREGRRWLVRDIIFSDGNRTLSKILTEYIALDPQRCAGD
jgi:hypothetical protein